MNGKQAGHGVQVVSVEADGSYRACGAALRGVAGRAELHALPVAVLSVAGATRGGKSFLLDFFLRYLRATPSAQRDGTWLGGDDEPLDGFSWRGGCECDTIGIQLWSEPFVLTKENGDKVVVLLMDTQGTFDSTSTLRDSTTIFAMSTLLSSVQIFNLSRNIQEDDLQYLQLFTEYGKLASEDSGTPFQVLQFLVRDWSYAYQHPLGAVGGQQFLEKKLQTNESQPEELREIRQHIKSSFESVRCFLMPHPGLTVATSPEFNGCLAHITKEFRDALMELVQDLFGELTLKKISGQEIQVQELVEYFESYMEVFSSDQIPTPTSILRATSSACLEAALRTAREVYVTRMKSTSDERSVPRNVMPRLHAQAKEAARQSFLARRMLAAPEHVAERLEHLLRELDDLLATHVVLNQAKVEIAVAASKDIYKNHMLHVTECLLLSELEARHHDAMTMAIVHFDSSRLPLEEIHGNDEVEDEDRKDLQQNLENFVELHHQITQMNEAIINEAMVAAKEKYKKGICQAHVVSSICIHPEHLVSLHKTSRDEALDLFDSRWTTPQSAQNEHRTELLKKISETYLELTRINERNNEAAVELSIKFYENTMFYEILGTDLCLHPLDLKSEHNKLYALTLVEFYKNRTYGNEGTGRDHYKLKLLQELPTCFARCIRLNDVKNNDSVKVAHGYYEQSMNIVRGLDALPEFLGAPDFGVIADIK